MLIIKLFGLRLYKRVHKAEGVACSATLRL